MAGQSELWPLWGYMIDGSGNYASTRGRSQEEALEYAREVNFPHIIVPLDWLFINAAKSYSRNHQFDWLHTPPLWFQRRAS